MSERAKQSFDEYKTRAAQAEEEYQKMQQLLNGLDTPITVISIYIYIYIFVFVFVCTDAYIFFICV